MITGKDLKELLDKPLSLTRQEIVELIDEEIDKDPDEMDTDSIDKLVELLVEADKKEGINLKEPLEIPNSEIIEIPENSEYEGEKDNDKADEQNNPRIVTLRFNSVIKKLAIVACFGIVLMSLNLAARAFGIDTIEILRDFGHQIIAMVVGEKTDYKGITIIRGDKFVSFNSVEDFFKTEKLKILYPTKFPDGIKLELIQIAEAYENSGNINTDYSEIIFTTNFSEISVAVNTSPNAQKQFLENQELELEIINGFNCYLFVDNNVSQCNFIYKDCIYSINARTYDEIVLLINNLKEYS